MRHITIAHGMRRTLCKGSRLEHPHHLKEDLVIKPLALAISAACALLPTHLLAYDYGEHANTTFCDARLPLFQVKSWRLML